MNQAIKELFLSLNNLKEVQNDFLQEWATHGVSKADCDFYDNLIDAYKGDVERAHESLVNACEREIMQAKKTEFEEKTAWMGDTEIISAIKTLSVHQEWRQGADIEMLCPKVVSW